MARGAGWPQHDHELAVGSGRCLGGGDSHGGNLLPHCDRGEQPNAGKRSWSEYIRSAKAPELPVVLLEDFAALIGLAFALLGVGLTLVTHNGIWDAVGTAMIGLLLVTVAIVLAIEMKPLLLGEAASPVHLQKIMVAITSTPGIDRVVHQRALHVGPEEVVVAVKVTVPAGARANAIADAIDAAEARCREAVPGLTLLIYLEPEIDRAGIQQGGSP
jgi:divalent metal cation (Fe/Co/Zn/Cd) transporter